MPLYVDVKADVRVAIPVATTVVRTAAVIPITCRSRM
jgi:hypothetical protein